MSHRTSYTPHAIASTLLGYQAVVVQVDKHPAFEDSIVVRSAGWSITERGALELAEDWIEARRARIERILAAIRNARPVLGALKAAADAAIAQRRDA